jgi:hypothetical protein
MHKIYTYYELSHKSLKQRSVFRTNPISFPYKDCLTLKISTLQCSKYSGLDLVVFVSKVSRLPLKDLLERSWSIDDIDQFVEENPETGKFEYFAETEIGHILYKPLLKYREVLINRIIDEK